MELFAINCTTCRARLKVREQSAIGQIVNCPKCGCMLQITAPPGWRPPPPQAAPALAIGPTRTIGPAQEAGPAQAMASVLAAAEAGARWSSPATDPAPAGFAPAAGFSPPADGQPANGQYVDPQAVRVDVLAALAVPVVLPAKPSVWWPVAKDCMAAWLPWASVPLAGMLSAWVVGYCLQTEPPTELALAPTSTAAGQIATPATPLATLAAPADDRAVAAAVPALADPSTFVDAPSPQQNQQKIEPPPSIARTESTPSRVALRPVTATLDIESASRTPPGLAEAHPQIAAPVAKPRISPPAVAAKPKPAMPSSVGVPPVDVTKALATRIASLELPSIPLLGFVQLAGGLSGAPLTLDADACRELAIKLDTPLAVHEHDVSLGELLKHVLEPHALMAEVVQGQLIVTATAAHRYQLQSVRYAVSDLNDTPTAMAGWIEQLVESKRWIGHGGAGRVDVDGPQLMVLQTPRVQHEVLLLLDKLRQARGKPAIGRLDPFEVSLESPTRQLAAQLETKVSVNYRHPAELETVVRDLAQRAGVRLLIDWQSLAGAGCRPQSLVSLVVDKQPLAAALDELLGPLELSYRVVAAETVEVASIRALQARPELEVYSVRNLLAAGGGSHSPVEAIGQWLAAQLPDAAWGAGAAWRFDRQSSCLLVRHDAMTQRAIEAALRSSLDAASNEDAAPVRQDTSAANPASGRP